jgi:hypothetical protein
MNKRLIFNQNNRILLNNSYNAKGMENANNHLTDNSVKLLCAFLTSGKGNTETNVLPA